MLPPSRTGALVAGSGVGRAADWRAALLDALNSALSPLGGEPPDLLFLFASGTFADAFPDLVREAAARSEARELVGCSASGVIGVDQELEGQPAVSALALRLPESALLNVQHVTEADIQHGAETPGAWPTFLGLRPEACSGLIVLADPFSIHPLPLIDGLVRAYPGIPLIGGLASNDPSHRGTALFLGSRTRDEGAIVVALSGPVALTPVVSQGAEPLGRPWTVTDLHGHVVTSIGNQPAYKVLLDTVHALAPDDRQRVARNLLIGVAMDEYRDDFKRGDFLIRNLMGADPRTGSIAVGGHLRVGQTVQFQVRDARAADEELRHLLQGASERLPCSPAAALLFACNGRGQGLFGHPHHDAKLTGELLQQPPLAGLFCTGEIGPVGKGTYLHGFTACLALFVPTES